MLYQNGEYFNLRISKIWDLLIIDKATDFNIYRDVRVNYEIVKEEIKAV